MCRKARFSPKSRELAEELRNNLSSRSRLFNMGYTREDVLGLGLVMAQLGVAPEDAVSIARLGKLAHLRGLKERDLIRVNVKE